MLCYNETVCKSRSVFRWSQCKTQKFRQTLGLQKYHRASENHIKMVRNTFSSNKILIDHQGNCSHIDWGSFRATPDVWFVETPPVYPLLDKLSDSHLTTRNSDTLLKWFEVIFASSPSLVQYYTHGLQTAVLVNLQSVIVLLNIYFLPKSDL